MLFQFLLPKFFRSLLFSWSTNAICCILTYLNVSPVFLPVNVNYDFKLPACKTALCSYSKSQQYQLTTWCFLTPLDNGKCKCSDESSTITEYFEKLWNGINKNGHERRDEWVYHYSSFLLLLLCRTMIGFVISCCWSNRFFYIDSWPLCSYIWKIFAKCRILLALFFLAKSQIICLQIFTK